MIAVIFEVEPAPGCRQDYLDMAAAMRPLVESIDGFISVERFQSTTNPNMLLSLSFFEDEAAVERWRNLPQHRAAQNKGRTGIFTGYRLRIAHVLRDYGMTDRGEAPPDSREAHGQPDP
ncbi:MAG: antibiotic biosynthesis monooxygenase [Geminicoccaceae bacterium]|nr:antibiotic biosynthesis monooxygenase [Geminicoccaceae bacterium]